MIAWAALGLVLAPQQPAAEWKRRGLELISAQRPEEAVAALARACELDPKEEDACYFLARQLFSLGRYAEAAPVFDKAVAAAGPQQRARAYRAAALNRAAEGLPVEAERHFREAVRKGAGPDVVRAEALTDYGAFLFREARSKEALEVLRQAAALHPRLDRAHAELGRVFLHLDQPREAAASLERAVSLNPDVLRYRLLLGRAYLALGRTGEAEREFRSVR